MRLNTLKPAKGSKKPATRLGRGIGSGFGKTAGRGHKGQHSRSGGYHKVGFEGGQMPLQRRIPKFGFTSQKQLLAEEVRVADLNKLAADEVTLETLKEANLISRKTKSVKIFGIGEVKKALTIKSLPISKGARQAVETAGGKVEE